MWSFFNFSREWDHTVNGLTRREDGPAAIFEHKDGYIWFTNGIEHRLCGPSSFWCSYAMDQDPVYRWYVWGVEIK